MTYVQDLDPESKSKIIIKLFSNVKNVPELRQKITGGSLRCCVVKPSLVVDPLQLVVAANKAVCAEKLKTRSVHNETLFNLSVSKNITQSLQTFGIHDAETNILVAVVVAKDVDESEGIFEQIDGEEIEVSELRKFCDENAVRKTYKIGDVERENTELIDSVITRIAVKDCLL